MRYGEIKIIGEQVFFDNVAVADIRADALHGIREDFKEKLLKSNQLGDILRSLEESSSDSERYDDDSYNAGNHDGRLSGYQEGYSDALANKPLDGEENG